eukprot:7408745-Alexandrium_andersonii.AAC.1
MPKRPCPHSNPRPHPRPCRFLRQSRGNARTPSRRAAAAVSTAGAPALCVATLLVPARLRCSP